MNALSSLVIRRSRQGIKCTCELVHSNALNVLTGGFVGLELKVAVQGLLEIKDTRRPKGGPMLLGIPTEGP